MKILLFDFDGVIVDTLDMSYNINNLVKQKTLTMEEYRDLFLGNFFKASADSTETFTEVTPFFQKYQTEVLEKSPVEGMSDLLQLLRSKEVPMYIVSGTIDKPIENFLNKYNLRDCFKEIYGSDQGKSKVHKINTILEIENMAPEHAFFITDTLGDVIEAREAGVATVAVTWGYHLIDTLEQGKPQAIAHSATELKEILLQQIS